MKELKIPIFELSNNSFKLVVDTNIYSKEALNATCYKYTDKYFIYQKSADNPNEIDVIFETKSEVVVNEDTVKSFCNDLIDQQVRFDVNNRFGHIRDLIVEEAFKPVNK
ncbi:MAG: His-Xaa-Ser system protein HxsD [Bacteroidales bacterium]|nr:His-Xaa-Ser system protein HxsD [Candidatus Sodaliphilus aphodohippi]